MAIALIRVVADWAVGGMAASYEGQKSFTMSVDAGDAEDTINESAHMRARELVASEGSWRPGDIQIKCLSWGRIAP